MGGPGQILFGSRLLLCEIEALDSQGLDDGMPGRGPMCERCDKLEEKILHYRLFLNRRFDPLTKERIRALLADLERQKKTMHYAATLFSVPEQDS
jgi:hypothetical protein